MLIVTETRRMNRIMVGSGLTMTVTSRPELVIRASMIIQTLRNIAKTGRVEKIGAVPMRRIQAMTKVQDMTVQDMKGSMRISLMITNMPMTTRRKVFITIRTSIII
uniref:Uncharacterized protein n=1 Tax=Cacopsylla melanoneura TaxID=428564 RepID=A0A8D8QI03_9HEMI